MEVVSGLLGTCDVIIRSASFIARTISDAKDGPRSCNEIKREADNLEGIAGAVQGFLKSSKAKNGSIEKSAAIVSVLGQCKDALGRIEKILADIDRSSYAGNEEAQLGSVPERQGQRIEQVVQSCAESVNSSQALQQFTAAETADVVRKAHAAQEERDAQQSLDMEKQKVISPISETNITTWSKHLDISSSRHKHTAECYTKTSDSKLGSPR